MNTNVINVGAIANKLLAITRCQIQLNLDLRDVRGQQAPSKRDFARVDRIKRALKNCIRIKQLRQC